MKVNPTTIINQNNTIVLAEILSLKN